LLEIEAAAISSELLSPGPNGEAPAGIKDPLIDKEGFPRGDIDIYNARSKRARLSVLNSDHKALMKRIEHELQQSFSLPTSPSMSARTTIIEPKRHSNIPSSLSPMARISEVLAGSPAATSGLMDGDLLLQFGLLTVSTSDFMSEIPAVVRDHLNREIEIVVIRNLVSEPLVLKLVPGVWGGRGVIGCHLSPIVS
jgi:26S proteasome non-ATPase regulatory subunit 9